MRRFTFLTLILVLFINTTEAAQFSAGGVITALRDHSAVYPTAALQGISILQLSGAFGNGCNWVYISANDKNGLSVALAAKAVGANVTVWFDNAITSPWGDTTTCAVMAIEVD